MKMKFGRKSRRSGVRMLYTAIEEQLHHAVVAQKKKYFARTTQRHRQNARTTLPQRCLAYRGRNRVEGTAHNTSSASQDDEAKRRISPRIGFRYRANDGPDEVGYWARIFLSAVEAPVIDIDSARGAAGGKVSAVSSGRPIARAGNRARHG